jgi:hypothetical protein
MDDLERRLSDLAATRVVQAGDPSPLPAAVAQRIRRRRRLIAGCAAAFVVLVVGAAAFTLRRPAASDGQVAAIGIAGCYTDGLPRDPADTVPTLSLDPNCGSVSPRDATTTSPANTDTLTSGPAAPVVTSRLFSHQAPNGSVVTASTGTVTIPCSQSVLATRALCGAAPLDYTTGPGVEFDYTVDGQAHRLLVLDSDPRMAGRTSDTMAALFGADDPTYPHTVTGQDLIILRVGNGVRRVRLTATGPDGTSTDEMAPVDGWVSFPLPLADHVTSLEGFDAADHSLGTTLPFPCC